MFTLSLPVKERPLLCLTGLFLAWKFLLATCILASPGQGYDTSATLLDADVATGNAGQSLRAQHSDLTQGPALARFARWDAIYFLSLIRRGYIYEQEWFVGQGFVKVISIFSRVLQALNIDLALENGIRVSLFFTHIFHLLSVFLVYGLGWKICLRKTGNLPFLAASLHIICPAGVFMSAPYSESLFSLLNILGFYLYTVPVHDLESASVARWSAGVISAGAAFGLATTVRGNGILSGTLFLFDVTLAFFHTILEGIDWETLFRAGALLIGGCLVAAGAVLPQVVAYNVFCLQPTASQPSWCHKLIPSIYNYVQSYYWNVGFLRYWTLSNAPLFMLAVPMLSILSISAFWALPSSWRPLRFAELNFQPHSDWYGPMLQRLALPQLFLAALALTTFHVQIITRIASGYPLWYYWMASLLDRGRVKGSAGDKTVSYIAIKWVVLYGLIQGALFSSFLPPA